MIHVLDASIEILSRKLGEESKCKIKLEEKEKLRPQAEMNSKFSSDRVDRRGVSIS